MRISIARFEGDVTRRPFHAGRRAAIEYRSVVERRPALLRIQTHDRCSGPFYSNSYGARSPFFNR
jgi:hypothetical protein